MLMVFFCPIDVSEVKIKNVSEVYLAVQFSFDFYSQFGYKQFSDFDPVNQLLSAKISFLD